MPIEIERRFLVQTEEWRAKCVSSVRLRDGLIVASDGRKVRVRIANDQATLTIKGARVGPGREEFEYPIPIEDGERLLDHHCGGRVLVKTRHVVSEAGCLFEVDVYEGILEGVIIAEIELSDPDQPFPRPAWLGEEVTGKAEYRKINMLQQRLSQIDHKAED